MKILFVIDDLLDSEIMFEFMELPHTPIKGDYVNILPFFEGNERTKIKDTLSLNGKQTTGLVYDRSWGKFNGEVTLMVHVELKEIVKS